MSTYHPVTPEIIAELEQIVGRRYVIHGDSEQLEPYSHDEITEKKYHHLPDVVVRPRTTTEIAAIMKLANRELIPVTPRGGGSGLSGGAVPVMGGIVLATDRMNSIIELDTDNMLIVVEPGVITNDIDALVAEHGLFFAGYPMSLQSCFIGGNVAENAGGGKAVKYGVTGQYILGVEMVTPEGEIVKLGGKLVKDVTGYDLTKLIIGSEGTLGIFTKVIIKLLPRPTEVVDLLVLFPDPETAIGMVSTIMTEARVIPTAIEFMDRLSAHASCEYLNERLPYEKAGAMLLIQLDGNRKAQLEEEYEAIGELCLEHGAIEVYVADNYTTQERIWSVRRNIAEAFMVVSPHQSLEDITVPVANIPKMIPELERLAKKYDIQVPCYGHAGDGNLHATPVKNPNHSLEQWEEMLPQILADLYAATRDLDGVISGEHGIGHKRKNYMSYSVSDASLELMKRIKRAFDPNNVLNPGKIFDV
ncbi:MAG: FAD-binding protein [Deltaproteobacteria bacterium]|nr:FAD-binding protein [Candidatus Anaeroferrophillacea bacterium]